MTPLLWKGVAAVDEAEEVFGRPRTQSLSRNVRHMSLMDWDEVDEDEEWPDSEIQDRRRAVSMSAVESLRERRSSTMEVTVPK